MTTDLGSRAAAALGRGGRHLLGAATLLAGGLAVAGAQSTSAQASSADPRWRAWIGCWSPLGPEGVVPAGAALTCVVPASNGTGVERLGVAEGRVVSRDLITASGQRQPVRADGCDGWQEAQWSADGRRLHLRSSPPAPAGSRARPRASSASLRMATGWRSAAPASARAPACA
jgi:hypothetical protein